MSRSRTLQSGLRTATSLGFDPATANGAHQHRQGRQTVKRRRRLAFVESLEARYLLAGDLTILGTAGDDSIVLSVDVARNAVDVLNGGLLQGTFPLLEITEITIDGLTGNDFINVVDPTSALDARGVVWDLSGGEGDDVVVLTHTAATADQYAPLRQIPAAMGIDQTVSEMQSTAIAVLRDSAAAVIQEARTQLTNLTEALAAEAESNLFPDLDLLVEQANQSLFASFDGVMGQIHELATRTEEFAARAEDQLSNYVPPEDPSLIDPNDEGEAEDGLIGPLLDAAEVLRDEGQSLGQNAQVTLEAIADTLRQSAELLSTSAEDFARRANELAAATDTRFANTETTLAATEDSLMNSLDSLRVRTTSAHTLANAITTQLAAAAAAAAAVPSSGKKCQITPAYTFNGGAGSDIFFPFSAPTSSWQINGGTGNDILLGGFADDEINGGDGTDLIFGLKGNDLIHGDNGLDLLFGEFLTDFSFLTGDDCVYGDDDIDLVVGDNGLDIFSQGTTGGKDDLHGGDKQDLIIGDDIVDLFNLQPGGDDTIQGDQEVDFLFGTGANDTISGGLHFDVFFGNQGDDTIYANTTTNASSSCTGDGFTIGSGPLVAGSLQFGNAGDDDMWGCDGIDLQFGGTGLDEIHGKDHIDIQFGMQDDDLMYGESGGIAFFISSFPVRLGNLMFGGALNDTMWGGGDLDVMFGNDDQDTMHGYDGNFEPLGIDADVMFGGTGNDTMEGDAEQIVLLTSSDFMFGQAGADTMRGGSQMDLMFGGPDSDLMQGDSNGILLINSRDLMFGEAGADTMDGGNSQDLMFGGDDADTMQGDNESIWLATSFDMMFGNDGPDLMNGGSNIDLMFGNNGADNMRGDSNSLTLVLSNDLMFGGDDPDTMDGGNGVDVMFGNNGDDHLQGDASVLGMVTSLDLMFGNDGDDRMDGGANQDLMFGNNDCDFMQGDNGAAWMVLSIDTMFGNDGCDEMYGGRALDFMSGGTGIDTMDGQWGLDTMNGGDGTDLMHGGDFTDLMWGDNDGDIVNGNDGLDIIFGGPGDDCLNGDSHLDVIRGNDGRDCIRGGNAADFLYGNNDDDTIFGDDGADGIHGGDGNDKLDGGNGWDRIWGNNNDDDLWGGPGNDFLNGGPGSDNGWGGSGVDVGISLSFTQGGPDSSGLSCSCTILPCKFDFGDAPNSYGTLLPGGARHGIVPNGPRLGTLIDHEADGQPTAGATGDDINKSDDEDGVALTTLFAGFTVPITVTLTNAASARLDAWVDFNANGVFGAGEQVATSLVINAGANTVNIATPGAAVVGTRLARFRVSLAGGLGPTGLVNDGEVEDYTVLIERRELDWGDAPDSYATTLGPNGPRHAIGGPRLGALIDVEANGQPSPLANGDDTTSLDDEDGVILNWIVPGLSTTASVTLSNAANARLDAWVDFNGNGVFDVGTETIFNNQPIVAGVNLLSFAVPTSSVFSTYARFRVSTTGGLPPTGPAGPGEVEDYQVFGEINIHDFGDAPDSYSTFVGSGGAAHLVGGPQLGALIDFDGNGQPSVNADADDLNFTDDEDGVVFSTLFLSNTGTATVTLANTVTGRLDAWVDFNNNGTFDAAEKIFNNVGLVAGPNALTFFVPGNSAANPYARFRVSTTGALGPAGFGGLGEVEDYRLTVNPGGPLVGDLNADGVVDAADAGLMFGSWNTGGIGDINGDGITDAADAGELFSHWTGDPLPPDAATSHWVHARSYASSTTSRTTRRAATWRDRVDQVFVRESDD